MNILVLNYEYPPVGGGGAAVCKDLCEIAAAQKNRVEIVTMSYKGLKKIEKKNGVTIHRIKCIRKSPRVCYPYEQLLWCILAYHYIIKRRIYEFDIIHSHFVIPTGLLAYWLKKKFKIKYIISAHGSDVIGHNKSRFKILYKLVKSIWIKIVNTADAVTAPSEYLINEMKDICPGIKYTYIPNGIYVNQYPCKKKKRSIITLSRLQKSKGIQDLIKAVSEIELGDWEINILGDGPYKKELEKMIIEKKLQDKVFLRGYVEGEIRKRYLDEAGIFFSGSRFESFNLSLLEATVSGSWIIATNIEPHQKLVNQEHLYSDINELIDKLSLAVKRCPIYVNYENECYDWENIFHQYNELYQSIKEK